MEVAKAGLEYSSLLLPEPATRRVKSLVAEAQKNYQDAKRSILSVGKSLLAIHEVFANHGNGSFGRLIDAEFTFTRKHANELINAYRVFGAENCNHVVTNFDDSALRLLAGPSVPAKAREEAIRVSVTKPVTHKVAKAIVEKHKPKPAKTEEPKTEPPKTENAPRVQEPPAPSEPRTIVSTRVIETTASPTPESKPESKPPETTPLTEADLAGQLAPILRAIKALPAGEARDHAAKLIDQAIETLLTGDLIGKVEAASKPEEDGELVLSGAPAKKVRKPGAARVEAELLVAWNKINGVRHARGELNAKRRAMLVARLGEPGWQEGWREAIEKVAGSRFCVGDNDSDWRADIEWFLRPDTVQRLLEGRYDGLGKKTAENAAIAKESADIYRDLIWGKTA